MCDRLSSLYDEGDLVEVAGVEGRVVDMTLVSTTVRTVDNQRLIIPNNKVWGEVIRNVEGETARRVDLVFGVSYSDDVEKVKGIRTEILESHPMVLKTHENVVRVHTLNNSSVDFVVRPWVRPADYWPVYWDVTEAVKRRFDGEGISIPFPQHDVHLIDQASA